MVWLPDGEKNFEDMFIRFNRIHERDGQTDRHRMDSIGNACIILRGQNCNFRPICRIISEMIQDRAIITMEPQ